MTKHIPPIRSHADPAGLDQTVMYRYDAYGHRLAADHITQFCDRMRRRISSELTEEEFLPLRLQDDLYYQRRAYMLRVAILYGRLRAKQLRMLSHIAAKHNRGYGHFGTHQDTQYSWAELEQVPDILAKLAPVEMHAIQTSGNYIRSIATDRFAGMAPDEVIDARPLAEILRQWSTFIPEFAFLSRRFETVVSISRDDHAVTRLHDIGVYAYEKDGQTLLRILAGGGMGRTSILGAIIKEDLPWQYMLSYIEAAVRVYNRYGRRDNKYKARIKVLVRAIGTEEFARQVEKEWQHIKDGPSAIMQAKFSRVAQFFAPPVYEKLIDTDAAYEEALLENKVFARWVSRNVRPHRVPGYAAVTFLLKPGAALPPGDTTARQMALVAGQSERLGFGEVRVTHEQNLTLPDMKKHNLLELWWLAKEHGMTIANIDLLTDITTCLGSDFYSLANAKSTPIVQAIRARFGDLGYVRDLGELSLNISGCINSCDHHHVGNIGILGVDKHGEEWYQVPLGDTQDNDSAIGKIIGPSFKAEEVPDVIKHIIDTFVANHAEDERFIDTYHRVGMIPFKECVYVHAGA